MRRQEALASHTVPRSSDCANRKPLYKKDNSLFPVIKVNKHYKLPLNSIDFLPKARLQGYVAS